MLKNRRGKIALLAGCLLIIPLLACDESDVIPPNGSTITVAGNPATIILQNGVGSSDIIATVRNELGVPLPGQDVRFSASSGLLHFPGTLPTLENSAANLPIPTDALGNSAVTLTTNATTTVTATAGNTTGTLTLNTASCSISLITLNVDNSADSLCAGASSDNVTSCNQEICFAAQAFCTTGDPATGINILFSLENNTVGDNTFSGTFSPSQVLTDANGFARTRFMINPDCPQECSTSSGGGPCSAQVLAAEQGGVQSIALQLTINIP